MSKLKFLNEIWKEAYFEFGDDSKQYGDIISNIDYEIHLKDLSPDIEKLMEKYDNIVHQDFDKDLVKEYMKKDGLLGEFEIKEKEIHLLIYPDYADDNEFDGEVILEIVQNELEELYPDEEIEIFMEYAKKG